MKIHLVLLAAALPLIASTGHAQPLSFLGTNSSSGLTVDPGSVSGILYSQSSNSMTVSIINAGTIGGYFNGQPLNWSSVTNFALLMSVNGTDPLQSFTLELFNPNLFNPVPEDYYIARFDGVTTGVSGVVSELALTKVTNWTPAGGSGGLDDFSSVVGMQFTWNAPTTGGTSSEATLVAIVPEPTTWALLVGSSGLFGALAWRRRQAAVRR